MGQRHITGKSYWYHETQSSTVEHDILPLALEVTKVSDPPLPDAILGEETLAPFLSWLVPMRVLAVKLFPDQPTMIRPQTFTTYERLSTALAVAQVCGVQWLCNYCSAWLTPLPGPDSSRESNHKLAQIARYTHQLASSPSIVDNRSYQHLNDIGLTAWDYVIASQIVSFIGFQAQTIATLQAYLGHPTHWLPGLEIQNYADASLFVDELICWRSSYEVEKLPEECIKNSTAELCQLAEALFLHPISFFLPERSLNSIQVSTRPDSKPAALLCTRIDGSPARFVAYMDSSNEYKKISPLLRRGENEIN